MRQNKIIGIGREVTGRRKDGAPFSLESSIGGWRAGGERYFTGIMRDVTDRKRAESALQRLNETLEQRVAERTAALAEANRLLTDQMEALQRAQTALQKAQKMEATGQLTGGIAHDFNIFSPPSPAISTPCRCASAMIEPSSGSSMPRNERSSAAPGSPSSFSLLRDHRRCGPRSRISSD